jgi:hypothetical protein
MSIQICQLLVLVVTFSLASNAPRRELKATILDCGLIESITEEKVDKTPETSSGLTRSAKRIAFVEQTDKIPARKGIRFGFQYLISGLPDTNEVVFTKVVTHPRMRKDDGSVSTGFTFKERFRPIQGMVSSYTGYGFDHDYELVIGDWKIEFWYGETKLIEKTFHVFRPEQK